jgi:hypothetical protein
MANGKHLLKLNEGVEAWNTWRRGNPYIMPDLRWANLRSADLREADLRWADLRGADLRKARNLSAKQLAKASTLDEIRLDPDLIDKFNNPKVTRRHITKAAENRPDISACPHCRRDQ